MWPASVNWGHLIGGRRSASFWMLRADSGLSVSGEL